MVAEQATTLQAHQQTATIVPLLLLLLQLAAALAVTTQPLLTVQVAALVVAALMLQILALGLLVKVMQVEHLETLRLIMVTAAEAEQMRLAAMEPEPREALVALA